MVQAGGEPILVEIAENYRIELRGFETKLANRAKAVIVSHMRGHSSDMDAIMDLCDARNIPVIEDAAHSLGTLWSDRKSLPGSITFFFTALIIVFFLFPYFTALEPSQIILSLQSRTLLALITAFMAILAEAAPRQGSDNLSLTLTGAFALDLTLHSLTTGTLSSFLGWILFSALLGYVAYRWRLLNAGGAVGAFILGVFIFGMGGWPFMVPLIAFFLLSNLLSKSAERHHSIQYRINAKGSNRDIVQVYANGGIALIITLIWYLTGYEWLYPVFIASLAAATADTWETEFGSFARNLPRHILSFKPVQAGFSGGITLIGTLGGALGASVIALLGFLFKPEGLGPLAWLYVAALAGFLASIVDSLLGATVQRSEERRVGKEGRSRWSPYH